MTKERAFQLITEALKTLKGPGTPGKGAAISDEMILLGVGSPLDSIGFVTFVTKLEERVSEETKKDIYLVLNEINEFNINKPQLTVDALARYIVVLSRGE